MAFDSGMDRLSRGAGTQVANPWLALEVGADPALRVREMRRAHRAFLEGATEQAFVRSVVTDSWRRSAGALVAADGLPPVGLSDADLDEYRRDHPLAQAMPVFRDLLGSIADDGEHVLAVCDERGTLLWVEGHAGVRRRTERINFAPGARWDEGHAGTNAIGTAMAVDHAVQIFATEHYSTLVQPWTCAAAPVYDQRTGRLLGVVDITGGDHLASPHSLALAQAAARAAEVHLAGVLGTGGLGAIGSTDAAVFGFGAAVPSDRLTHRTLSVRALGHDEAILVVGPGLARLRLGRRHSEIAVLLAAHPEGLSGEQLALELYGERSVNPVTLRAELSRLRQLLGPDVLASRPYRFTVPLRADFLGALGALDRGAVRAAADDYRGPLLPGSEAPGVARIRNLIEGRLRGAVLDGSDAALLDDWTRTPWGGEDLQAWEALLATTPDRSPRRPMIVARVGQLRLEYGLGTGPGRSTLRRPSAASRATFAQRLGA
jgi:hypothetical protein